MRRILRLLSRLQSLLTLGLSERLDRTLVRNAPLLWRSALIHVAWLSLLASMVLGAIGLSVPDTPQGSWTSAQIESVYQLLRLASVVAILFWMYLQWRIPLGERSLRDQAMLVAYSSLAVFFLLLPPYAFVLGATHETAQVLDPSRLEAEYAYHDARGFWYGPRFDGEFDRAELNALSEFAREFGIGGFPPEGLDAFLIDNGMPCPGATRCVVDSSNYEAVGPTIQGKLESIGESQRLWMHRDGYFFSRYVVSIPSILVISVLVALALNLLFRPAYTWRRRFPVLERSVRPGRTGSLWIPRWLRRLDKRLLRKRPMSWAARTHVFIFRAVTIGSIICLAVFAGWHWFFDQSFFSALVELLGNESPYLWGFLIFVGALGPIVWAFSVGSRHIPATDKTQWRSMTKSFFVASASVPVILYGVAGLIGIFAIQKDPIDLIIAVVFAHFGVTTVVSWCLVRNYIGWRSATLGCALPFAAGFAIFMAIFALGDQVETFIMVSATYIVVWAVINFSWAGRRTGQHRIGSLVPRLAFSLGALPSALFFFNFFISAGSHEVITSDEEIVFSIGTACAILATLPMYLYGMTGAMENLVHARLSPGET